MDGSEKFRRQRGLAVAAILVALFALLVTADLLAIGALHRMGWLAR